jgi:hypothetical protein
MGILPNDMNGAMRAWQIRQVPDTGNSTGRSKHDPQIHADSRRFTPTNATRRSRRLPTRSLDTPAIWRRARQERGRLP